ncbi:hypothetical protein YC2023_037058 [Brassica napus]
MTSQYAATYTMPMLRRHGDPRRCVMVLGREALRLESSNNVIVVVILLYALDNPQVIAKSFEVTELSTVCEHNLITHSTRSPYHNNNEHNTLN